MEIISENAMTYYCNAAGDAFYWDDQGECRDALFDELGPDRFKLIDENIPRPLRDAYNRCWNEGYGYPCYIMEVKTIPYVALVAELGDLYENRDGYVRNDHLKERVLTAAESLSNHPALTVVKGTKIFFPEDTTSPFCQWELVIAIPARKATEEILRNVAKAMDESLGLVYEELEVTDICWDVAGPDELRERSLPDKAYIPWPDLLLTGEDTENAERGELSCRVADWLSKRYDQCIISFSMPLFSEKRE